MRKVPAPKVVAALEAAERPLPAPIHEALGELVGAARKGLLALSVGVGLGVVHELMELEVTEVLGPKGTHNPDRTAKRHGHQDGSMTLGGRRVRVRRPRVRTADDGRELPVGTYEYFADYLPSRLTGRAYAFSLMSWMLPWPRLDTIAIRADLHPESTYANPHHALMDVRRQDGDAESAPLA